MIPAGISFVLHFRHCFMPLLRVCTNGDGLLSFSPFIALKKEEEERERGATKKLVALINYLKAYIENAWNERRLGYFYDQARA